MSFLIVMGIIGIVYWLSALLISEDYKKSEVIAGLSASIFFYVVGGIITGFSFSQFASQFIILLI
jgi:hypothetical protein